MMPPEVDTVKNFEIFRLTWKIIGMNKSENNKKYALLLRTYDLFILTFFSIGYVLHSILITLGSKSIPELCKSLLYTPAVIVINIRLFAFRFQFANMEKVMELFSELDAKIKDTEAIEYHRQRIHRPMKRFVILIYCAYFSYFGIMLFSILFANERSLIYNGWFPFDWKASNFNYACAILYQTLAGLFLTGQSSVCDGYGPVTLCCISEHVQLFAMRIVKSNHVGDLTEKDYYAQLKEFSMDYERLMRLTKIAQKTISWSILAQFMAGAIEIGFAVILMMIFSENNHDMFSYALFIPCLLLQYFPICYYGSFLTTSFGTLPHAFFSCDWIQRDMKFRYGIIYLTEFSLRPTIPYAAGRIRINLDTLLNIMKGAYSLLYHIAF